ncbi:hypothetical protein [Streptomyces gardneri]|uniref:hypothetical protein n=1 Tax=Streptomyces gardneri TaxID=66892 RepID=UPI0035D65E86
MTTVTPLSNHFFFLASQALPPALPQHDQRQPFVLRVEGDGAQPEARVVPHPKALNSQGSAETRSQQWSMTAEGRIVSRLSGYAMAWDDDDGVLVAAPVGDPARPHQFWSVAGDGRLASRTLSGHVLTVSGEANPVLAELDGESVSDPVRPLASAIACSFPLGPGQPCGASASTRNDPTGRARRRSPLVFVVLDSVRVPQRAQALAGATCLDVEQVAALDVDVPVLERGEAGETAGPSAGTPGPAPGRR